MSLVDLLAAYGPIGATIIGAVAWLANVYVNKIRPEQIAREERTLHEHKELTRQMTAVVEKNTEALMDLRKGLEVRDELDRQRTEAQTAAMVEIKDQLRSMGEDIAALFAKLEMPRPSRRRSE